MSFRTIGGICITLLVREHTVPSTPRPGLHMPVVTFLIGGKSQHLSSTAFLQRFIPISLWICPLGCASGLSGFAIGGSFPHMASNGQHLRSHRCHSHEAILREPLATPNSEISPPETCEDSPDAGSYPQALLAIFDSH